MRLQEEIKTQIDNKRVALATAPAYEIGQLENEIKLLEAKQGELKDNFLIIATGIDYNPLRNQKESSRDWSAEIQAILEPVLFEMNKLTKEPRRIHKLQSEIEGIDQKNSRIAEIVDSLKRTLMEVEDEAVKAELRKDLDFFQGEFKDGQAILKATQGQFNSLMSQRKNFIESFVTVFELFFRSRARNLALALLAGFLFWIGIHRFYRLFNRKKASAAEIKLSKSRIVSLIIFLLSTFGAVLAFFAVLFFFNDWLLIIVNGFLLLIVAWAGRQALPRYWQQVYLLLNIGPVKEGELIVHNDLPMKVESLKMYTTLVNPLLSDSHITLPLVDFVNYRSRPISKHEIWFPTAIGDYVIMPDGTFGYVKEQDLDDVLIELLGGSRKIYQAADFNKMPVEVLSNGFRISAELGLDYKYQKDITTIIPDKLCSSIKSGLAANALTAEVKSCRVEFKQASASSLDLAIIIDFAGTAAARYNELKRLINRLAVDACNQNGWSIPFAQMDLHIKSNISGICK